jgi:hypothetical protein
MHASRGGHVDCVVLRARIHREGGPHATRNEIVADSWTRDWAAFESREEAFRAGRALLTAYLP